MKKIPLTNLFLYEFDIDVSIVDQAFNEIMAHESWESKPSIPGAPLQSSWMYPKNTNGEIFPVYQKELFKELQKCVDLVCEEHFINQKLVICDSWLTKTEFGQGCVMHSHSLSVFSGLLYFTDQKRSETLFTPPDPFHKKQNIFQSVTKKQNYSLKYTPQKGKLILWDSELPHQILAHTDRNKRYTLSFNTFFSGNIDLTPTAILKLSTKDAGEQAN